MLIWKLTKHFAQSLAHDFDQLVESALGDKVHAHRKKSFILSREAMRLALCEAGHDPAVCELRLKNHCRLERWPQYLISLSHTKEAGAAAVVDRQKYISVGVDIELQTRDVSESVSKKVTGPRDLPLRKIELWCLKEAVYKCLMNTGKVDPAVRFSQIEIQDRQWSYPPAGLKGDWELTHSEGHVVALATLSHVA